MISYRDIKQRILLKQNSLSIIIFSLFFGWLLAFPFEGQILYALIDKYTIDAHSLIFWAIAAHFVGLFTCGYFVKNIKSAKRLMRVVAVFCMAGSIMFFFSYSIVWHISLVGMSFLAGFFVASWGFYFKHYTQANERIKTAADVLIYSNIFMIIINVIAVNISAYAGLVLSILLLVVFLLLSFKMPIYIKIDNKASHLKLVGTRTPVKPLFFLFLFITIITINSGLMYQVINPAFAHHQLLTSWYWAAPYIVALYIVRNLSPKTNRAYILYVAIAMIGFAFIFFMFLDRSVISYLVIDTLMLGACGVCDLFWWSIIGEMLDYSDNPAKILGIGLSANVLGVFIGGMIGNTITLADSQTDSSSVIALMVVLIILIILPLLNKCLVIVLKNHAFLEKLSNMADSEQKEAGSNFAERYELTGRESEIVSLLSKGRTYKMIADELCLSENTIKTHIKNIYSKVNIKSKAELVKLLIEDEKEKSK